MPLFRKRMPKTQPSKLDDLTLKGFGGGLNTVEDDTTMAPRFAVILKNFRRTPSGGQQIRFGSSWFCNIAGTVNGNILDMQYFNGRLIIVTTAGEMATSDDSGNVTLLWNAGVAGALPGSPAGWGNTFVAVSFVSFKDRIVIHNGVDKPVEILNTFVIRYLQDEATGANINVPIGKYGAVAANYHCIAGIPGSPTTIYIGAVGTSGTFPGDPAPNDAISIDVGAYSPSGAASIRGVAGYRNFLIVFFQGQSLLVQLGTYDANGVHKPQFPDTLPKFGLLGQRCIAPVQQDLLFAGLDGYSDAKRNLFSGLVTSDHVSARIEPLYRGITGNLSDSQQQNNCFLIHDPLWRDTILFNPSGRHFVHSGNAELHYSAFSEYNFPTAWTCACTSFLGRVFYAFGTKVFQHGNTVFAGEGYTADRMNDRDFTWAPNTMFTAGQLVRDTVGNKSYTCNVTHTSGSVSIAADIANNPSLWTQYMGIPITAEFELPWLSSKNPLQVKKLYFVNVGTIGTAEFSLDLFVDGLYKDDSGNVVFNPALTAQFIGGTISGFGFDAGPFGGGRKSNDPRLWGFPLKFKRVKPRFKATTAKPLQITDMTFLYAKGRYSR